jgi:uncharacterized protein
MLDLKPLVHEILKEYPLSRQNIHGIAHWARVLENGLRLAERIRANEEVVQLFAIFHDSRRVTVRTDPSHGLRGANFAAKLRGRLFDLSDDDFDLLFVACAGHTDHPMDDDPTVQICWDADRLDVGRAGANLEPLWLGEATVDDNQKIVEWADQRARAQVIPDLIGRDWGVATDGWKPARPPRLEGKPARPR